MNRKHFLILAGMLSSVTLLQAATNYVAITGNDTNSGSFASPFLTIQKAVDVSPTGSVILVGPGTYSSGQNSSTPAAGKSRLVITKNITVRSLQGAQQTIILGQKNSELIPYGGNSVRCVFMTTGVLDGFTLKDGYADTSQSNGNMDDPIINGGGVCVPVGYTNTVINNCIITGCSAYRGAASYHGTLNNCTLVNNKATTAESLGCVWSTTLNNSIVRFNEPEDFPASTKTDESKFSYCCLPSLPGNSYGGFVRNIAGNITDDLVFQLGTFIPERGSPCIDKGSNDYINGTRDAAGLARRVGAFVDIGAYEVSFLPYTLTVVNGQGSGTYTNGDVVSIAYTNTLPQWMTFMGWTGDTNTVDDVTAPETTLVMPARATTVTASYQVLSPIDEIISEALGLPLPIATSNVTVFSVNPAAHSVTLGGIGDEDVAFFETVYTNAGTVTFSWNVSSEADWDRLSFYVDGHRQAQVSGEFSGVVTQYVANVGSGLTNEAHRLRWEYSKDDLADSSAGADQGEVGSILWIPNDLATELGVPGTNNVPSRLSFPLGQPGSMLPFPYGFQGCYLDRLPPTGATNDMAVKLGGLINGVPFVKDSQATGVEVVLNGAGTLSFRWYTSCREGDRLVCSVDGVDKGSLTGNSVRSGWTNVTVSVTGTTPHVVRWRYVKDANGIANQDCGWIDNVTWTRQTCTLSVDGGSGSGQYFIGDTVPIIATNVTPTKAFGYWSGDVTHVDNVNSMTTTVYMVSDTAVRANYKSTYELTVTAGSGSGWYFGGQTIPVTATIPPGMIFDEWSGDAENLANPNSETTTFLMPERDVAITARFKVQPYSVSVVNGRESGSLKNDVHEGDGDTQGVYPPGAEVRIIAYPAPLWKIFTNWTSSLPGVTISNEVAEITSFTMPSESVVLTANYRDQTPNERIANALTIRGQRLDVTAFSTNGVVAQSSVGGIRYNDTVVMLGGPSVASNQSVSVTTTNFMGDGILCFWWRGDSEAWYDGLSVEKDGARISPIYSEKTTNLVSNTAWNFSYCRVNGATTDITFRFSRDESYLVHNNFVLLDRVTWIPKDMCTALNSMDTGDIIFPNINQEFDPCFVGHARDSKGFHWFSGEDGGVRWDSAAQAIKLGHFGYVTNNQLAQVAYVPDYYETSPAGGIQAWEWKTDSEGAYDKLEFMIDLIPTNWISGKLGEWTTNTYVLKRGYLRPPESPITDAKFPVFGFRYKKDYDQSMNEDCGWMRKNTWVPTYSLNISGGTSFWVAFPHMDLVNLALNGDVLSEADKGIYPTGTQVTMVADPAPTGMEFERWLGDVGVLSNQLTEVQTFTIPKKNLSFIARYKEVSATPSPPSPSPAPQIKNFKISDTPAPSYPGMFAAPPAPDQVPAKTVTMTFEGISLLGVSVEWSPSLSEPNWVKLPITATQELANLPDGRLLWEVKASEPPDSPQGFFRLIQTE